MYPVLSKRAGLLVLLIVSGNKVTITNYSSPKSMNLKDLHRDRDYGILVEERDSKLYSKKIVYFITLFDCITLSFGFGGLGDSQQEIGVF